jgi:hypothetical protein
VGLEPTSEVRSPPVFKTGSSSSRMTSVSCGSWNRTNISTFRASHLAARRSRSGNWFVELRGQESNLRTRRSKRRISTTRNYPAMEECPAGVEPACPAWKAGTFAARPRAPVVSARRKPWDSNPQRTQGPHLFSSGLDYRGPGLLPPYRSAAGPCFRPDDFQQAAVAGIEPAPGRLTVAFPYQHGTHRIETVSVVGFEPTISCARGTRIPKLSHTLQLDDG